MPVLARPGNFLSRQAEDPEGDMNVHGNFAHFYVQCLILLPGMA